MNVWSVIIAIERDVVDPLEHVKESVFLSPKDVRENIGQNQGKHQPKIEKKGEVKEWGK